MLRQIKTGIMMRVTTASLRRLAQARNRYPIIGAYGTYGSSFSWTGVP